MRRKEVLFAVAGGFVGAILAMVGGAVLPLGAQNQAVDVEFGTITCDAIRVGSPNESCVLITAETLIMWRRGEGADDSQRVVKMYGTDEAGGQILVFDQNGEYGCWITGHECAIPQLQAPPGRVAIGGSKTGGYVATRGEDGKFGAIMEAGDMVVFGKDGMTGAWVSVDEKESGRIRLFDNSGEGGNLGVYLGIDEHGGVISVGGKKGMGRAQMVVDKHGGGRVDVFGNVDEESRASMMTDRLEYGVVKTWDSNGHSLETLGGIAANLR